MTKLTHTESESISNNLSEPKIADANKDLFDDYHGNYKKTVNDSVSFTGLDVDYFTKVKAEYIREICEEHFGENYKPKLLDVGCGVGNFHPILDASFNEIHGVDVSEKSIDLAKSNNSRVYYKVYDGRTLPFEGSTFDVAITICVMHHVEPGNWSTFLDEMHRVLKPGGIALIFEHNPRNPLTLKAVNQCPFDADATLLHGKQTVALLKTCGFTTIKEQYILSVPAASKFARSFDRLLSCLTLGAQYYVIGKK